MARKHCDVLKNEERAVLKALVTSEYSANKEDFKNEFNFDNVYTDLNDALKAEDIDIVYILSPNTLHEKQVVTSLKYGKNVFCEKPLCYTRIEFDSIEKSLAESKSILQVGMNCRYREQFSIPHKKNTHGELGDLRYIKGTYIFNLSASINSKKWWIDYPEGIFPFLHSGAIHSLDLIRWVGGKPISVSAIGSGYELKNEWVKDNFAVIIEFENGTIAEFTGSASANRPADFSIELWGSKGSIVNGNHYFYENSQLISKAIEVKQERVDLLMQFDDLIYSIENNKQPMNSFSDARKNFDLITGIEDSVKSGKKIKFM